MSSGANDDVELANRYLRERFSGTPIHGAFRLISNEAPYPLLGADIHCIPCNTRVGGAFDFSGEVGSTDALSVARRFIELLAEDGCVHARALVSKLG